MTPPAAIVDRVSRAGASPSIPRAFIASTKKSATTLSSIVKLAAPSHAPCAARRRARGCTVFFFEPPPVSSSLPSRSRGSHQLTPLFPPVFVIFEFASISLRTDRYLLLVQHEVVASTSCLSRTASFEMCSLRMAKADRSEQIRIVFLIVALYNAFSVDVLEAEACAASLGSVAALLVLLRFILLGLHYGSSSRTASGKQSWASFRISSYSIVVISRIP